MRPAVVLAPLLALLLPADAVPAPATPPAPAAAMAAGKAPVAFAYPGDARAARGPAFLRLVETGRKRTPGTIEVDYRRARARRGGGGERDLALSRVRRHRARRLRVPAGRAVSRRHHLDRRQRARRRHRVPAPDRRRGRAAPPPARDDLGRPALVHPV